MIGGRASKLKNFYLALALVLAVIGVTGLCLWLLFYSSSPLVEKVRQPALSNEAESGGPLSFLRQLVEEQGQDRGAREKISMVTKSGTRIIQNQLKEKAPLPWHTASHIAKNPPADLQAELESLLDSPELDKKLIGAAGLVRLGDPAGVPLLEKALQTMPDPAKILAAETLAGAGNEEGLDTLLQIIAGKDWGLRLSAIEALGEFSQNSEALSTLRQHLQDQDLWTRVAAAAGLARMGDEQGISLLHTYLDSPDPAISIFAAERLAAQGDPSPAGLFEKELQSQDPFEQVHGAAGLMMLGDDRGYDILMSALAQEHEPLGLYAAQLSLRLSSLASDQK